MIGSPGWPEAAIWITIIAAIASIFSTLIWQLGRCLTEYIRQESETARALRPGTQTERIK